MTPFLHALLWLFIGLFIGASLGVVVAGLCVAAGREPNGRWISVSERLPEIDENVIALLDNGDMETAWVNSPQGTWSTIYKEVIVTHWMPLPPSPEGKE